METINYDKRQEIIDNEHLNLLSVFYFVYGGMSLLVAFAILGYVAFFSSMFSNTHINASDIENVPLMSFFYIAVGIFVIVLLWAALFIVAGIFVRKKTKRVFSLVIGISAMLSFPLGTALGVFAIVVFTRNSVIELYRLEAEREQMALFDE